MIGNAAENMTLFDTHQKRLGFDIQRALQYNATKFAEFLRTFHHFSLSRQVFFYCLSTLLPY